MDFGLREEQEMTVRTVLSLAEKLDPVWKGKLSDRLFEP